MSEYVVDFGDKSSAFVGLAMAEAESHGATLKERIVRCKDCKHAQVRHPLNPITGVPAGIEDWRCDYFWNADELPEVEPDGYCAWGERRDA